MSENNNISSSSKSLLPKDVIDILNKGMKEGFKYDFLDLRFKKINDSMIPELCEWIIKLGDKVRILDLGNNQITSVGASMLFDILKTNDLSLKGVYLYGNKTIDDNCLKSLGEYIKSNTSIEITSLSYTSVSDTGIEILVPYLDGNTTFKQLHSNDNKGITIKSIQFLEKMIESSCLENIGIENTLITQKSNIHALLACNRIKNGSTSLNLSGKELNDDDLIKICEGMKKYGIDKLNKINLMSNKITSKGASVLFDTLNECKSVVSYLDLSFNHLDDECMNQLGEYLQENEHLEILKIIQNKITDKSAEILSEYLIGNTKLKELYLFGNKEITDASVLHLIEMANKSCIAKIWVSDTSISEEKQQELEKALSMPIEEREIPIKSNTKSAAKIQPSSVSTSIQS